MIFPFPKTKPTRLFSCLILGHFAAYGMGPFYIWPLMLICLSTFWILFTSFATEEKKLSYFASFLFGFGYFVSSLWWIGNALLVGGNPYKWVYPLAVCGLPILLALFPMIACGIIRQFAAGRSLISFIAFVGLLWASEFARGTLFSGFPWNLFGMTWTNNLPMLQTLSIGGVYFLSFITIFIFTTPAFVIKGSSSKWMRGSVALLALLSAISSYYYGTDRLNKNPTRFNEDVVVQIIQPNIAQEDKWDSNKQWDNYRSLMSLIEPVEKFPSAKIRAVIMPETALTYHDFQTPQAMDALRGHLNNYNEKQVYILSGALLRDDAGYHNSLVVLDKSANFLESFDKFHLVPFGEYIPFQKYIPIPTITQFSGFASGDGPHTLSHPELPPFSPLVCYEVIFPSAVVSKTELRPDWLVNVTNDAWYGISPGPFQHMAQAQYRAIEEGLPMVRAANTGISVVIDAYGRIVTATGLYHQSNIETLLPNPAPETLYSKLHK